MLFYINFLKMFDHQNKRWNHFTTFQLLRCIQSKWSKWYDSVIFFSGQLLIFIMLLLKNNKFASWFKIKNLCFFLWKKYFFVAAQQFYLLKINEYQLWKNHSIVYHLSNISENSNFFIKNFLRGPYYFHSLSS